MLKSPSQTKQKKKRPQKWRMFFLSLPRRQFILPPGTTPALTPRGIRVSAVSADCGDRFKEIGLPYLIKVRSTVQMHKFDEERMGRMRELMHQIKASSYSRFTKAGSAPPLKELSSEKKKSKAWSESDWRKHGESFNKLALPKTDFSKKRKEKKKKSKPLNELLPRLLVLAVLPEFKIYRKPTEESNYRDPTKVARAALTYVITDRVKKLAEPRVLPTE